MFMVGEYKADINIERKRTVNIKKASKKGRKRNGLSTPPKYLCQGKRKKDNKHG